MPDKSINIDILLYEHETIRAHVNLVADTIIERCWDGKVRVGPQEPERRYPNIESMLIELGDGLLRHHSFEEKILPLFIGDSLVGPIAAEHAVIIRALNRVKQLAPVRNPSSDLEKRYLKEILNSFRDLVIDHCTLEDVLLQAVRKLLPSTAVSV